MTKSFDQIRDEVWPGVYGSLGPQADVLIDRDLDILAVASPWGGFVITRQALEDGSWKEQFGRRIAELRERRGRSGKLPEVEDDSTLGS